MILPPKKQQRIIYYEIISLKNANKSHYKGLKYCKFKRNRNKAKHVMKKISLKDYIISKYIEHKQNNNTGIYKSICISDYNVNFF